MAYPSPRQLQLRRGNAAAVGSYTGLAGELTVNTTDWTLQVHDGSTVGGHAATVNTATLTDQISSVNANITIANVGMKGYVDQSNTIQSAQVGAANLAIIAANLGMKGYVDSVASQSIYGNGNVKSYLTQFDGNIVPSANAVYSLGSVTNQWKSLFVSNNTIYVGGVPLSIDTTGNLTVNGNIIPTISYVNTAVANVVVDLSSYALNANVTAANVGLKGYVDQANTIQSSQLTSANLGIIGYIDLANTIQSAQVGAANLAITTANTAMKGYVDSQTFYSNARVATYLQSGNIANVSVAGNITATYFVGNGALLTGIAASSNYSNVNVATYLPTYAGNIANIRLGVSGVLTFADGTTQTTAATGGGSSYSNVNVAAYLTTNSYLTSTTANLSTYAWASNVTTANTGVVGYVDLANTIQSNQLTAANTAWAANAALQQSLIGNLQASAYSNVNLASYLAGNVTVGTISLTGNVNANNLVGTSANTTITAGTFVSTFNNAGNVILPNVYVSGNVTSTYFLGNGALLTGIAASSSYSNVQVATYLPTYSGVVTASNVAVAGNVTAQYLFGNGSQLTGIASSYSNVQTAAYLNATGYNLYSNTNVIAYLNATGYNLYSNVNLIAYLAGNITTGNVTATGNISGANYITANVILTNGGWGNISNVAFLTANTITTTGNVTVGGNLTITGTKNNVPVKTGGFVAQNTAVSIDSITAQWLNTGAASANQLSLAALNGNVSILYTYTFQDGTGGSTTGGSASTTLANLSFGWTSIGNPSGVAGDMYNVLVTLPGTNAYRITAMTGSGYSNNVLTIERLV